MPTYLGEDVGQEFLDMIVRVYRQGYEAAHPDHTPTPDDDLTIIATLESTISYGGPDADSIARYLANPIAEEGLSVPPSASGQVWPDDRLRAAKPAAGKRPAKK